MNSTLLLSGWGRRLGKKLMKGTIRGPKLEPTRAKWNIVTGDSVQVTQGPHTGQQGKVLVMLRKDDRVIIEGVNMRRRIVKNKLAGTPGKIVTRPCSIHYSNIALVDPSTGKPTKISRKYTEQGAKVRVSKATGHIIPKPEPIRRTKPRTTIVGSKDTVVKDVFDVTFADYEKYIPFIYGNIGTAK